MGFPGDPNSSIPVGQQFMGLSHQAWNAMLAKTRGDFGGYQGGEMLASLPSATMALIQNNSGSDVSQFGVLGISGVIFTPSQNQNLFNSRVLLTGTTPTYASYFGKFAVCLEPIASGQCGRAYIAGTCPAKVNIVATTDLYCDIKNSDLTQLQSGPAGSAKILYGNASTGVQYCVIQLGVGFQPGQLFRVKLTQTGGSNGTQTSRASWTYSIDPFGSSSSSGTLGTGISPVYAGRAANGTMTAATRGLATFDGATGAVTLEIAYENPGTGHC